MKSLRSPVYPVSGLPITPRGIFRNLGIPQKSKWRRNVTEYLSKLDFGEFYKTAKLQHFFSNGLVTEGVQSLKFDREFPKILM